jgi:hypothetical protein
MIRWRFVMPALVGSLMACDDVTISQQGRRAFLNAGDLAKMQEASGSLIEIHGAAWPGATPEELASTLRSPNNPEVRFRAVRPGAWVVGSGKRIVLHFNPVGGPNSNADCLTTQELETKVPTGRGFTVNASFCRGTEWIVRAYMTVGSVETDDWLGYTLVMRKLLGNMFPED